MINRVSIYIFTFSLFLISCLQNEQPTEGTKKTPLTAKSIESSVVKPSVKTPVLDSGNDFHLSINIDSINLENISTHYEKCSLPLANKIRKSIGQELVKSEEKGTAFFKYKMILLDEETQLLLNIGPGKYGYGKIYASLYKPSKNQVLNTIEICESWTDVYDSFDIRSVLYPPQKGEVIIGVYKRAVTDDFSMGNIDGIYQVNDSLNIFKVNKTAITKLKGMRGN